MSGKLFGILKANLDSIFSRVCSVLKKRKCYDYKAVGFIAFVSSHSPARAITEG